MGIKTYSTDAFVSSISRVQPKLNAEPRPVPNDLLPALYLQTSASRRRCPADVRWAVAAIAAIINGGLGCQQWRDLSIGTSLRCAPGLVAMGPRCCAAGQILRQGHCAERPRQCPSGWLLSEEGCSWESSAIRVEAGKYTIGPNDWESENVPPSSAIVAAFWIDQTEVTNARWNACVHTKECAVLKDAANLGAGEPGLPVTRVSASQAASFCAAHHGRLPRTGEWLRVAAGEASRRFPWGHTGLVCRRASYGLVHGPCAEGAVSPEWAASRPDGKSELGLFDLVGNVAEITESESGQFEIRGGSFRSDHAAELKSWSVRHYESPDADVGFRCVYDQDPQRVP